MSNNLVKRQKIIRQTVRQYRRQLTCEQQNSAADKITHLVLEHELIRSASHLALFLSFDGEINTNPLIKKTLDTKQKSLSTCFASLQSPSTAVFTLSP